MTTDTRERIIQECNTMLISVGPSSMTMDDVARACGISKRTLYEAFPDKRTLIRECVHRQHQIKNAEVKEIFETSNNCFEAMYRVYQRAREVYKSTSVAFINDIKRLYPEIFDKHMESEKVTVNGLANVLRKAQEEGLVIKRINPEIAAYLFVLSMRELHEKASFNTFGFKEADLFDHVFISFLRGVATLKGIEMVDYLENPQTENQ
ncbi:MAG: TetR/AcrR family transcriptional regulator [Muribaculaceae bacterium]|nr:TetR/AcrR family transcriptional regulator [Muribaculaceae bacterium]MBR5685462.1 TetR/AcrR family transcriptional regulator [Muribaculaceae bacterium]